MRTFWLGNQNAFYSRVSFCIFPHIVFVWYTCFLMSQMNLAKKNLKNLVWIRVIWYVWYHIGWIIAWLIISFRCRAFWWWVIWWWRRVTFTTILKYWLRVHHRMYRQWQYIFYYTNIGCIMDWLDVVKSDGMGWIKSVWLGSTRMKSEYFGLQAYPMKNA